MSDHKSSTEIASNERGFKNDVHRLGEYVGQLHDDLSGIAKGVGEVAQSGVVAAKESGRNAMVAAKEMGELKTATLRKSIATHPGATMGVAVGVGILVGFVGTVLFNARRNRS